MTYEIKYNFIAATLFAALLASCGGGGDGAIPVPYGALAINQTTKAAGIATSASSQDLADAKALSMCGSNCTVMMEFSGSGRCGALARASNGSMGWSSASALTDAKTAALEQCVSAKGADCSILLYACN
jgi:Domain of unknown function (DUF4189)